MTTSTFALQPLSKPVADAMRLDGAEVYVADSKPGYPCRQCLRDAEIGEELILLSHDPFADGSASPYRSASPIFVHRHDCADSTDHATVPDQLAMRQLSVRSFDENEMMIKAAVIDGTDLELANSRRCCTFTTPNAAATP